MKKKKKAMKRRKTPEIFLIPEISMTLETLETPEISDVLYVEMQDMYEGSAQKSSWPVKGIVMWQQPNWFVTLSMPSRWLVQPSNRVTNL